MSKTILIPTDLRVESLNTLKIALNRTTEDGLHVMLMYSEWLNLSIQDLLWYSPRKILSQATGPHFNEGLAILRNRFTGKILSMQTGVFHGYNVYAFQNFASAHSIDEIYIPQNYTLKTSGKSFNPIMLIKKSGLTYQEVGWDIKSSFSDTDQLDTLFNT